MPQRFLMLDVVNKCAIQIRLYPGATRVGISLFVSEESGPLLNRINKPCPGRSHHMTGSQSLDREAHSKKITADQYPVGRHWPFDACRAQRVDRLHLDAHQNRLNV